MQRTIAALILSLVVLVSCSRKPTAQAGIITLENLKNVAPWTQSTNYGDWQRLEFVACKIQKMDTEQVASLLDQYTQEIGKDDSVPYLLFRVIFDVPTNSVAPPKYFKIWRGIEFAKNSDATFNISWPIEWDGSSPHLMNGNFGSHDNAVYVPSEEYRYFLGLYPFRKLKCQ